MIRIALSQSAPAKEVSITRFEELFGIRYLPFLECENWEVERHLKKKCARAHKKHKIGHLALWLGKLHSKQLSEGKTASLTIRWIHEKIGYGAFTEKMLPKWSFIGEYTGILRARSLLFPDLNDYCFMYPKEWLSLKAFTIDSEKQGNLTRFINHSDSPNCESLSIFHEGLFHVIFRTTKEVPADTELTYDYGNLYWKKRKKLLDIC